MPRSFARSALQVSLLAGLLLAGPPLTQAQLPSLGDGAEMSLGAEKKMGERIARELYRDPDYLDDPVLAEYVQAIWQPLLVAARTRGELTPELDERFAWEVLLGRDRTVNAFALPGGYLGVHLGLIAIVSSRDELASVLAHELSHVTQRHIARMMTQQSQMSPWMIASVLLGVLAAGKSPDAANALIVGGQAVGAQKQLNFSRDMEREADRIGYGVMTQAGFQPRGFVTMFDKLQKASRLNDNGSYPYLRTHPLTTERIADMQARQQLDDSAARAPAGPTLAHAMVAARARVLANAKVDDLRGYQAEVEASGFARQPEARQAASLYAAALASGRLREGVRQQALLARLGSLVAGDAAASRQATLLAAELAFNAGDSARVLALLDANAPGRPERLLWAQAATSSGRAAEAAPRLQALVTQNPRDASAWELLSAACAAQGQTLRAIRAEGESRVAQLDYQAALDRFKAAQEAGRGRAGGDHIEASIIDTRTRQVQSLLREQALER